MLIKEDARSKPNSKVAAANGVTTKPVGNDVVKTVAGAGATAAGIKPAVQGAMNAATLGATTATAGNNLANIAPTTTVTDTSERDAYLAALSAQLQQQQEVYDQMNAMYRQQYEAQQKQLAADREAAKRNAYINNQVALKNLPTELAADGINGGLAESSRVRLRTAMNRNMANADYLYNQEVADAYQNMLKNKAGVEQNKANANLQYTAGVAKAPAAKTKTVANQQYINEYQNAYNQLRGVGYSEEKAISILEGKGYKNPYA